MILQLSESVLLTILKLMQEKINKIQRFIEMDTICQKGTFYGSIWGPLILLKLKFFC